MTLHMRKAPGSPVVAEYDSLSEEDIDFAQLVCQLERPSARFLEAAALFLVELARRGESLPSLDDHINRPEALRRLGFIADSLSRHDSLPTDTTERLGAFADRIHQNLSPSSPSRGDSTACADRVLVCTTGGSSYPVRLWEESLPMATMLLRLPSRSGMNDKW